MSYLAFGFIFPLTTALKGLMLVCRLVKHIFLNLYILTVLYLDVIYMHDKVLWLNLYGTVYTKHQHACISTTVYIIVKICM